MAVNRNGVENESVENMDSTYNAVFENGAADQALRSQYRDVITILLILFSVHRGTTRTT